MPKILKRYYTENSLLFLGCSLHNDRTLRVFQVTKTGAGDHSFPQHFAFEQVPEKLQDLQTRNSELLRWGITPIWFPKGQYDKVESLLRHARNELNYLKAAENKLRRARDT